MAHAESIVLKGTYTLQVLIVSYQLYVQTVDFTINSGKCIHSFKRNVVADKIFTYTV